LFRFQARRSFRGSKRTSAEQTGLDFVSRESTVCIDPADYLAFMLREQALNKNSAKVKLGESLLSMPILGGPIRPEQLEWMASNLIADGFTPDKSLPPFPEKALRELMAMNPYWRGPKRGV
jgi:hypothetical protein